MKSPAKSSKSRKAKSAVAPRAKWSLRLYVAGPTSKSISALQNLEKLCEEHLVERYHIEVIDLVKTPQLAQGDQILAIPALVRKLPAPMRKVIGDLSNTANVLVGLDLRPHTGDSVAARKGESK